MIKSRNLYALPWTILAGVVGVLFGVALDRIARDWEVRGWVVAAVTTALIVAAQTLATRHYDKKHGTQV